MSEGSSKVDSQPEHEIKFVFDYRQEPHILGRLKARCHPDGEHPTGVVSSIYFDTCDWRHLGEKVNSDYLKTKVRARWYSEEKSRKPLGFVFLEAKFKIGSRRHKLRLGTRIPAAELARTPLSDHQVLDLLKHLRPAGVPLPGPLIPTFEIAYTRHRFVDPPTGARLSLDTEIHVPRTNEARLPFARPLSLRQGVFEVKGPMFDLPPTLADLRRLGCRKQSFSKYGTCYSWMMGTVP